MKRSLWGWGCVLMFVSAGASAERHLSPDVHTSGGQQSSQPCNQCCVYQNQNYTEGAVIKAEGVLLQCQRDERTVSTNPLVWRRVKP